MQVLHLDLSVTTNVILSWESALLEPLVARFGMPASRFSCSLLFSEIVIPSCGRALSSEVTRLA